MKKFREHLSEVTEAPHWFWYGTIVVAYSAGILLGVLFPR